MPTAAWWTSAAVHLHDVQHRHQGNPGGLRRRHGPGASDSVCESIHTESKKRGRNALKKKYPPEFLNRLDAILVFNAFTREQVGKILDF